MKTLETAIEIQSSPQRVWQILTDFAAYPGWNPFIPRISGQPAAGARLAVHIRPPGSRGMSFRPTVLTAEPGRELRWRGRLLLRGVFDGEHAFLIEPAGATAVRFVQREVFQGILVPLLARSLDTGTLEGFRQMNAALKRRAEAG